MKNQTRDKVRNCRVDGLVTGLDTIDDQPYQYFVGSERLGNPYLEIGVVVDRIAHHARDIVCGVVARREKEGMNDEFPGAGRDAGFDSLCNRGRRRFHVGGADDPVRCTFLDASRDFLEHGVGFVTSAAMVDQQDRPGCASGAVLRTGHGSTITREAVAVINRDLPMGIYQWGVTNWDLQIGIYQ